MITDYTDDVSGIVIGDVTAPYEFWQDEEITPGYSVPRRVARGHFANDAEAVAWFRSRGFVDPGTVVEMKVFDQ